MMIWVCFLRSGIGNTTDLLVKEIFTRPFFVDKVLGNFDTELTETRSKKRGRVTFLHFDNIPTHRADDNFNRSESKGPSIRSTARILHPVTSGYSKH
jgi:hypothetical protein